MRGVRSLIAMKEKDEIVDINAKGKKFEQKVRVLRETCDKTS